MGWFTPLVIFWIKYQKKDRLTSVPLAKFIDDRGTICIAQVGSELLYDIDKVIYSSNIRDISRYTMVTIIVARGTLKLETSDTGMTVNEDHCILIKDTSNVNMISLSDEGLLIIITHNTEIQSNQSEARFEKNFMVNDCEIHPASPSNVLEHKAFLPDMQRVFYIKNVKNGSDRGGHAHKYCHQALIAIAGDFEVHIDDGQSQKSVSLSTPQDIFHVQPYIWATEKNFSEDAICLVLASHQYDRSSYIDELETLKMIKSEVHR